MSKNKVSTIALLIILIVLVGGVGYYFYFDFREGQNNLPQPSQPQTIEEKMLEFKNMDQSLAPETLAEYEQQFKTNKDFILNNPQALNPSYWLQIARLKKYMLDYDGAKNIYSFLISRDPANHTAEANLADLYANYINNYPQAAEHYWQAARKTASPQITLLYYRNLADIYAFKLKNQRQDFETQAQKLLEQDHFKNNAEFFSLLAKYYENLGDNKLALEYLEKAWKLTPDNRAISEKIDYLKSLNK